MRKALFYGILQKKDDNMFDKENLKHSRTWPIFMLAFVRTFYTSIFERALSNYLYFVIDINESTLGFISSVGALAYMFSPIIGQVITSRIGNRNALILSSVITPLLTGLQMLYFEPWFLITCRIGIGLSLGLFWPNCLNLIRKWQSVSSVEKANRNFRNFNFSWNFGFIFGLLLGFYWTFSLSDYYAMIFSWSITFLLIPISIFIKEDSHSPPSNEETENKSEQAISQKNTNDKTRKISTTSLIMFPMLFSWIGITVLTVSKSIFLFGYPVFLKTFGMPSYLTYIVQCGLQFTTVIGLTLINSISTYKKKITSLISIIMVIFMSSTIVLFGNLLYISIMIAMSGLFLGIIHGVAVKIMLEYGIEENTSKYSTINEVLIGMGFGLTPIIAGYVFEVNIHASFVFIAFFGLFALALFIYLSRDVKKEQK